MHGCVVQMNKYNDNLKCHDAGKSRCKTIDLSFVAKRSK
jgi:hypothetical protein